MVARLEKTEKGYSIPLSEEMVESLGLTVGDPVDVRPTDVAADTSTVETISEDEALRLYQRSKKKFGAAYEALAK